MTITKIVATPNSQIFDDIYINENGREVFYSSIKKEVREAIAEFTFKIHEELVDESKTG